MHLRKGMVLMPLDLEQTRQRLAAARARRIHYEEALTETSATIDQLETELYDAEDAAGNVNR